MNERMLRDQGAEAARQAEERRYELDFAIAQAAVKREYLTSDDVWAVLAELEIVELHHPNAMGGAILRAARCGILEPTDRSQRSRRIGAHKRKLSVWRSTMFPRGCSHA